MSELFGDPMPTQMFSPLCVQVEKNQGDTITVRADLSFVICQQGDVILVPIEGQHARFQVLSVAVKPCEGSWWPLESDSGWRRDDLAVIEAVPA